MKEFAKVVEVLSDGRAVVEVNRSTACENCASKCMVSNKTLQVRAYADNHGGAKAGDIVAVEMDLGNALYASLILYGIPILSFFAGAFLGFYGLYKFVPLSQDLCGVLLSLAFTGASWFIIRALDRAGAFKKTVKMRILS